MRLILGIEIRYVFRNSREADTVISAELTDSQEIRIFTGRGNQFQSELYAPVLDPAQKAAKSVRILLPDPYRGSRGLNWIEDRERELQPIDASFGNGQLRRQIRTSIEHVEPHLTDRFQLRLFDLPHIGRVIVTDRFAFFTPYAASRHGRDSRVVQYGRGEMYDAFARFFEMAWRDSVSLDEAKRLGGQPS